MNKLDLYTESFKAKYESFLIGCDSIEEIDLWDKDAYGEMDIFYTNDIVSVILRLIAADGDFSEQEAVYVKKFFGLQYSSSELKEIYDECGDAIEKLFDEEIESGIAYLRKINGKLADAYKELLLIACDIIIESDGVIAKAETELARQLKNKVAMQ